MKAQILVGFFVNLYRRYFCDALTVKFIRHNAKIWRSYCISGDSETEILFEQTGDASSIVACSYLANVLARRYQAKLVGYRFDWPRRLFWLEKLLTPVSNRIYQSFNFVKFLNVAPSRYQRMRAETLFQELSPGLCTKRDIEQLVVHGVAIGDLCYDEYLRQSGRATIRLGDKEFADSLKRSLSILVFWEDYLESHKVGAVCVSHCVYKLAILLRLAVARGIPAYQANATHVYFLTRENCVAYTDFFYYKEQFAALSDEQKENGLREAEERIGRRFSGEVGVDMPYSTLSAYSGNVGKRVLRMSNRKKVLVATHSFVDAPHAYGVGNLFPDFYEWLDFLGEISESTDYDWYVKMHPDHFPVDPVHVRYFIEKYPKLTLLPSDVSHHQIIKDGIDSVLTVWGTIGFEYAALGVPVINASQSNPHIAYNFNLHPKSVEEYRYLLHHIGEQNLRIDPEEIREYYYMRYIYNSNDWLFEKYSAFLDAVGGYSQQFTAKAYGYVVNTFNPKRHEELCAITDCFVKSGVFRLTPTVIKASM